MTDRTVRVRLEALTSRYQAQMAAATAATRKFGTQVATTTRTNRQVGGALGQFGIDPKFLAGTAIAAGLKYAIGLAIDFESSFAGIRKTVDGTDQEFEAIAQGMRDMSKEIPINVNELNRIGEAAGQLGVSKSHILGFTETIAQLGVTTNLQGEEAAATLARIANITEMPEEEFDRLGSTIVALGNAGASTEAEIADFALRMAGAGEIAGLTEADILGIANAMSSVGVESERGGTAVQKVLLTINDAVATGDENLATFAETAGMSAQNFAQAWEANPGQVFTKFVEGLGKQGKRATGTLKDLELTDQRLIAAFLALGGAGDELRRSMELGNQAWEENNALQREAAERFGTTESRIDLAKNKIDDAALSFGQALTPAAGEAAEMLGTVADRFNDIATWIDIFQADDVNSGFFENLGGQVGDFVKTLPGMQPFMLDLDATDDRVRTLGIGMGVAASGSRNFKMAQSEAGDETSETTGKIEDQITALDRLKGATGFLGIEGAAIAAERAQQDLVDAQAEVNKLIRNGKRGTADYKTALMSLREAELRVLESQLSLADVVQTYIEKVKNGEVSQKDAIALVREYGKMAGLTKDQLDTLISRIKGVTDNLDRLPKSKSVNVNTPGLDKALADLIGFKLALDRIPDRKTVYVSTVADRNQRQHAGGPAGSGGTSFGSGLRSDEYPTILQRGELVLSKAEVQGGVAARPSGPSGPVVLSGALQITNWKTGAATFKGVLEETATREDNFTRDRASA